MVLSTLPIRVGKPRLSAPLSQRDHDGLLASGSNVDLCRVRSERRSSNSLSIAREAPYGDLNRNFPGNF